MDAPFHGHEVLRNLELFGFQCEGESWKILPEMNVTAEPLRELGNYKKIAAIAPGTVWETKKYPEKYFREIIKYLSQLGYGIVLIGGRADQELCARLSEGIKGDVVNKAGRLSVPESVGMLKQCNFIVCNDSAPTHLAMAAGIPAFTLYCSTVPEFGFYPYSKGSRSLGVDGLKCRPCGIHGYSQCPIGTFECAWKLTPDMVIEQIQSMGLI